MAITHFNFHLLIFKLNPCRFSIFYCGCKQPKSVHILKLRAKVRFFVETSAVFLPKLLWHPLSIPFFPIFANPKPQIASSSPSHRALRFCRSNPSSPSHRALRFCRSNPLILQIPSFGSTKLFLRFNWKAEPSTLTRRAFAIATPKARQVDDEPSATS